MSEAPERIWAGGDREWDSGSWGLDKEFDNDVEYLRADLIAALVAAALENSTEYRNGKHLLDTARRFGWPDDGEGAFNFISRSAYALGGEDAKSNIEALQAVKDAVWEEAAQIASRYNTNKGAGAATARAITASILRARKDKP
jgi:hypothetical protein